MSQTTKKTPTIYMLYIKYILANDGFRARYPGCTNKELMKNAIDEWKSIPDSKKNDWKTTYTQHQHLETDVILQILFDTIDTSKYHVVNTDDIELKKETPLIMSREQMPKITSKSNSDTLNDVSILNVCEKNTENASYETSTIGAIVSDIVAPTILEMPTSSSINELVEPIKNTNLIKYKKGRKIKDIVNSVKN